MSRLKNSILLLDDSKHPYSLNTIRIFKKSDIKENALIWKNIRNNQYSKQDNYLLVELYILALDDFKHHYSLKYNQHHLEHKAYSQKSGNVANVRSSREGDKNLQFLSGCNF